MTRQLSLICFSLLFFTQGAPAAELSEKALQGFARLSLECIDKEYPNKTSHIVEADGDRRSPKEMHPLFFGCFDWHSSVHGHWALVKALKLSKDEKLKKEIVERLSAHFKKDLILKETDYFQKGLASKNFERPYGYAWFLRLAQEIKTLDHPQSKEWQENLKPLEDQIVKVYMTSLKKFNHAVRIGLHANTAFSMSHIYDYAVFTKNQELLDLISLKAKEFYLKDRNCPVEYEPSGEDFLSPCLAEADIMARVLPEKEFGPWFSKFIPAPRIKNTVSVQIPGDFTDLSIVHLVGLNFQKSWTLQRISQSLPKNSAVKKEIEKGIEALNIKGAELMARSDYAGTHWLASFAIFSFTGANLK